MTKISENSFAKIQARFSNMIEELGKHEVFVLAASLAYTTGLALAPFVLIILSLTALIGENLKNEIFKSFNGAVGEQAGRSIQAIIDNADSHPTIASISGIFGFVVLLVSASAIFSQLRYALDKINEHKTTESEGGIRGFLKERLFSVGLLLGFIFLFIASLLLTTTLAVVMPAGEGIIWETVSFIINLGVFTLLFSAIYRFVPTDKLPWKKCLISGATSSIFFIIGKTLIALYLGNAGLESSYGAAGSIVVFLVWVYYSSLTLLLSYEFVRWIVLGESIKVLENT